MAALPVEILLGIYLGLLTGIIPAVVSWGLGFIFKYFTGVSIPALAVVVLSLAIAGASGGLLALNDPTIRGAPNSVTLTTAIIVVLMVSLYAHSQGDKMGATLPRHISLKALRDQTLSTEVVDLVGGRGQVRITVVGEVEDMEGYPPLSADLRREIREDEWTLPADLPLSELETRLADTLRTEFDLADVSVSIDERGRATVIGAPPTSGVSKRVPPGKRAVSVRALVPAGLARGDEVRLVVEGDPINGTIVSAQSTLSGGSASPSTPLEPDGGDPAPVAEVVEPRTPTTDGGDGRLTVAVSRSDAERLLRLNRAHVVVRARGTRREYELLSLLRLAGRRFRKLTVGTESELEGTTIGDAAIRDTYGVAILAVRGPEGWTLAPRGATRLEESDELFVVGTLDDLNRFGEVIS